MGNKPSAVANTAATSSTVFAVAPHHTMAVDPALSAPVAAGNRFGMPHALVISVCIATAALLAPSGMSVRDILLLIGGAGGIGAVTVAVTMSGVRRFPDRANRFVRAYRASKD
ncbi:hypothetical protein ACIRD4_34950 [Streptomyces clavifer]|uniref:hypothetical protein n=1 Tax=Streptomyces clavifer TaxID=68188 RepID=UPI00381F7C10